MAKSILDPGFKYTPSSSTDIRKTFARIRREQKKCQDRAKLSDQSEKNSNSRKILLLKSN